jgi:hypothetical protein
MAADRAPELAGAETSRGGQEEDEYLRVILEGKSR